MSAFVPAPKITPVPPAGGSRIGNWDGPVVAVGAVNLNVDLTYLPLSAREQPFFQDQLRVVFASKDANLTSQTVVLGPANFFATPEDGPNAYVQIPVVSVTGLELCAVQVDATHSIVR
jgi:hypothetical protein